MEKFCITSSLDRIILLKANHIFDIIYVSLYGEILFTCLGKYFLHSTKAVAIIKNICLQVHLQFIVEPLIGGVLLAALLVGLDHEPGLANFENDFRSLHISPQNLKFSRLKILNICKKK